MKESRKSKGRQYPDDTRQRALTKLASGEASLRKVSSEYGISVPTLIKWRKQERLSASVPVSATRTDHGSGITEIQRLREEVERLREERDRLRRSIAMLIGQKIAD
jgi:transposase-like protein